MVQIVEVAGEEIEFPDEMSDQEIEAVLQQQFGAPQQPQQQRPVPTGRGIAARRRQRELSDLRVQAEQSGIPLARDLPEIGAAPELNELTRESLAASIGATFTFDDKEVGQILTEQAGATVQRDVEGNLVATFPSGGTFAINKPGLSGQDIAKGIGAIGAFTPAGRMKSLLGLGVASAATQAGIETGQAALGGDFDISDVVLAGVAAPAVVKTVQGAKAAIGKLRGDVGIPGVQQVADDLALQQIDDVSARRPIQAQAGQPSATQPALALEEAAETPARRPISALFSNETETKQTVRQVIESGLDDGVVARKIIDGAGKVKADPIGKAAIRQGVDEGVVAVVKGSNNADKIAYAKMLNVVEKGLNNKRFAAQNRPSDIVGDSLVERVKAVRNINKQANKDVKRAALNLKGKQVNLDEATTGFEDDLLEFGIVPDGKKLDFAGSVLDSESLKSMQKPINNLWADYQKLKANPDGLKAHQFKKLVDELVDFNNSRKEGFSAGVENLAKGLRFNINQSLRNLSNEYRVANQRSSETIQALQDFQKAAGSTIDLTSPNADKALGVLSRRLLSNVQSRVKLMDSITNLERAAKNNGARIDDDIFSQVMFVDELENSFGSFAPTSIQGIGEKVARSGAKEALIDRGVEAVKGRLVNEQKRLKVLKQLVGRQ